MTERLILLIRKKESFPFHLALSGGETAKSMFVLWVDEYKSEIDWEKIHFYWVDERCVSPDSPESNYGNANKLLFEPLNIPQENIHRIKGEEEPGAEAVRYSWEVRSFLPRFNQLPMFDCIILGVGTDLHTASIFPHTMELLHSNHIYSVSRHPVSEQYRITMTGPVILNCTPLLVPVLGTGKGAVIQKLREGYTVTNETPATYILSEAENATVYMEG